MLGLALSFSLAFAPALFAATSDAPPPSTPREFFNAGTQKLQEGKLREAEAFLEAALGSQDERLQPFASYNLGHVRFDQGVDELKKGPKAAPTAARGRMAAQLASQAEHGAQEALVGNDVQKMVTAYLNGRGARRELKAATKAVKRAMESYGTALGKWQRASGDFKSAFELKRNDADAHQNADIVDRNIAKLVDSLRDLQQAANAMQDQSQQLAQSMKQLKGRIPAPDMPPGSAGDDDDDEDMPNGPKPGDKEGATKEGEQMTLSAEEAGWLLEGFRLENERRLPMSQSQPGQPTDRNRKSW
ncbi:MAG TPA: hypothetical protein VG146_00770 [Verrucomicrobiae bacterium]|nr:hypothetical protein [Verrucomicrobiae bacterium]